MLSSAAIQLIAIISMTFDHIGLYLLDGFIPFRIIGRLAFPLFALMLVEGFRHTSSRKKYLLRIVITAFVSVLPCFILSTMTKIEYVPNILFTLAFSLLALMLAERGGLALVALPFVALLPGVLNCEYGTHGVLLVLGFYYAGRIFANNQILRIASQAVVLAAMMFSLAQFNGWGIISLGVIAIIPIALYSGKKGKRLPRLFGYIYYPAHLFVILFIKLFLY
jgi:hypothetical protein